MSFLTRAAAAVSRKFAHILGQGVAQDQARSQVVRPKGMSRRNFMKLAGFTTVTVVMGDLTAAEFVPECDYCVRKRIQAKLEQSIRDACQGYIGRPYRSIDVNVEMLNIKNMLTKICDHLGVVIPRTEITVKSLPIEDPTVAKFSITADNHVEGFFITDHCTCGRLFQPSGVARLDFV